MMVSPSSSSMSTTWCSLVRGKISKTRLLTGSIGNKICLSQPKHINHGLEELDLTECKPSSTPFNPNLQLREASDKYHEKFKKLNINYCSAIGLLSYIACYDLVTPSRTCQG
ncbi:hypothetical protein VP01_2861g2, partial [Puccinia sorghi]